MPSQKRGSVVDVDGNPIGGADIQLTAGDKTLETKTGQGGEYQFDEVPLGQTTMTTKAEDFEESELTIEVTADMPPLEPLTLELEVTEQASQLRGLIRAFDGTPVKAHILILPDKTELETDESGSFRVDLPKGKYTVRIRAKGYRRQSRNVEIEENSVTIMNVDLRKRK